MFWSNGEIKKDVAFLKNSVARIESILIEMARRTEVQIKQLNVDVCEIVGSDNEGSSINRIHDKLTCLLNDEDRKEQVLLAEKTLDIFEDYMKNVDKINGMINEFKGCVVVARGALEERKELDKQTDETKKLAQISQEIYKSMLSFIKAGENIKHEAHFKINSILSQTSKIDDLYDLLLSFQEKKSRKAKKKIKKKRAAFPNP